MAQHALDGEMGLAGIGGAQYGGDISDLWHGETAIASQLGRTARKVKRNCPIAGQAVKELDSNQNEGRPNR